MSNGCENGLVLLLLPPWVLVLIPSAWHEKVIGISSFSFRLGGHQSVNVIKLDYSYYSQGSFVNYNFEIRFFSLIIVKVNHNFSGWKLQFIKNRIEILLLVETIERIGQPNIWVLKAESCQFSLEDKKYYIFCQVLL